VNWLSESSADKSRVQQLEERIKELEAKLAEAESKKETQLLKQKIAQLEAALSRYREELEAAKRRISEMQAPYRDVETKLKEIIGDSGEVTLQYGGYRIIILDKQRFPWSQVVELVLDNNYEMWLGKDDKQLFICCKPVSD
jgi:septal ring factor EnvC (AmiA/AmiB activator)